MSISASDPVYALCPEVLTALGSGAPFWEALCLGKSGLIPVCQTFPDWFPNDQRNVGALSLDHCESRLQALLDRLLSYFDDRFWPLIDGIYAATSLGDLIGKYAGAPHLAIQERMRQRHAPLHIVSSACSSGSDALSLATLAIRAKQADVLLVLAVDSLCPAKLSHHITFGTQSPTRGRPFDLRRDGTSFGEGGAFCLLASQRGLDRLKEIPFVEILGVGFSCDGYDITVPDPTGQWAAMAIERAKPKSFVPDYINAHGTGTLLNDAAESKALRSSFDVSRCLVSSTKGATGHCLGAAGLIEAVIAMLALNTGRIPPTAGLEILDPALELTLVHQNDQIQKPIQTALSVTFGFGGVNSAITMKKA
jgi:3-oxoacyl-(acyl-carrier-protein) synthase